MFSLHFFLSLNLFYYSQTHFLIPDTLSTYAFPVISHSLGNFHHFSRVKGRSGPAFQLGLLDGVVVFCPFQKQNTPQRMRRL